MARYDNKKRMTDLCNICQKYQSSNQEELLLQGYDGGSPWNKTQVGLFEIEGQQYLVAGDHFTSFLEVEF